MLAGGLYERTSGAAGQPLAGYRRREPKRPVLYELVAQHAQTMLAEMRAADPEGEDCPDTFTAPSKPISTFCGETSRCTRLRTVPSETGNSWA